MRSPSSTRLHGACFALGVAFLSACSDPAKAQATAEGTVRLLPVHTRTLGPATLESVERNFTGIVLAARTVAVGVQVGGQVREVFVQAGDRVEQGDLLVQLDERRLQANLLALDAQIQGAEARLAELEAGPRAETIRAASAVVHALEAEKALAERLVTRREQLLQANSTSQEDVDSARTQVSTLKARIAGAQAQLDELEAGTRVEVLTAQRAALAALQAEVERLRIDLADTRVLAPFAGTVQTLLVQAGATVAAGTGVAELVEAEVLEAHFGVPFVETGVLLASQIAIQHRGEPLTVTGRRFLPTIDATHRTVTWIFELAAQERVDGVPGLLPGAAVQLALSYPLPRKGWKVPLGAITEGLRGMWTAYVVETDGTGRNVVVPVDLEILHTGPENAVVTGALSASTRLLIGGLDRVVPGQQVEVLPPVEGAGLHD